MTKRDEAIEAVDTALAFWSDATRQWAEAVKSGDPKAEEMARTYYEKAKEGVARARLILEEIRIEEFEDEKENARMNEEDHPGEETVTRFEDLDELDRNQIREERKGDEDYDWKHDNE